MTKKTYKALIEAGQEADTITELVKFYIAENLKYGRGEVDLTGFIGVNDYDFSVVEKVQFILESDKTLNRLILSIDKAIHKDVEKVEA